MWKKSEAPLNNVEIGALVAILRLGEDAYGLRIRDVLGDRSSVALSLSHVYATLSRLEGKGLVRSSMGEPSPQRGGRRKRIYTVTASGKAALRANYRAFKALVADLEAWFKP